MNEDQSTFLGAKVQLHFALTDLKEAAWNAIPAWIRAYFPEPNFAGQRLRLGLLQHEIRVYIGANQDGKIDHP